MLAVFVHVSDIHFGQEKDDRVYIHADVKQQLIADAKEVVSNISGGVAHGILVTGDVAQSGTWAEYEVAGKWLDELAANIGVEIHQVQMGGVSRNRRNFRQPINVAYLTLGRCVPASPA